MDLVEVGWGVLDSIDLAQDRDRLRALVNSVMNLWLYYPNCSSWSYWIPGGEFRDGKPNSVRVSSKCPRIHYLLPWNHSTLYNVTYWRHHLKKYTKSLYRWVYGLCQLSWIVNTRKQNVSKLNLFPSSGERRETPIVLGPLERANLNHLTRTMDKVHKLSDSKDYTPSSENFRFYKNYVYRTLPFQ
jgi:hypothetical protein